jgi:hypothetical protein
MSSFLVVLQSRRINTNRKLPIHIGDNAPLKCSEMWVTTEQIPLCAYALTHLSPLVLQQLTKNIQWCFPIHHTPTILQSDCSLLSYIKNQLKACNFKGPAEILCALKTVVAYHVWWPLQKCLNKRMNAGKMYSH